MTIAAVSQSSWGQLGLIGSVGLRIGLVVSLGLGLQLVLVVAVVTTGLPPF